MTTETRYSSDRKPTVRNRAEMAPSIDRALTHAVRARQIKSWRRQTIILGWVVDLYGADPVTLNSIREASLFCGALASAYQAAVRQPEYTLDQLRADESLPGDARFRLVPRHPHVTAEHDMRARWLPDPAVVESARAALDGEPEAYVAMIPMVQPGKDHGFWQVGQVVQTIGHIVLAVKGDVAPAGYPEIRTYGDARNCCIARALAALGDRKGTVAYAIVYRDGDLSVFEE